jgi:tetratricopeptide (TPR) repeat protein
MSWVRPVLRIVVCFCLLFALAACAQDESGGESAFKKAYAACIDGNYQEARVILESALASANLDPRDPRRVSATEVLATAYQNLGDTTKAADLHATVLSTADEDTAGGATMKTAALNNLGNILVDQGRMNEARPLLEKALTLTRKLVGDSSPDGSVSFHNLGALYMMQGRLREAVPLLEQAVGALRTAPPQYAANLVSSLGTLAKTYSLLGQDSLAMPLFQEALVVGTRLGGDAPAFADTLLGLGSLYRDRGDPDRAEPLFRKALAIYQKTGCMDQMRGATALSHVGFLRLREHKYFEAEKHFRASLDILRKAFGPNHISVGAAEVNLALACVRGGKYQESDVLLRHSREIESRTHDRSVSMARGLQVRAELDARLRNVAQAETHFREAIAMLESVAGPEHPLTADALLDYAAFLKPSRKKESALLRDRALRFLGRK